MHVHRLRRGCGIALCVTCRCTGRGLVASVCATDCLGSCRKQHERQHSRRGPAVATAETQAEQADWRSDCRAPSFRQRYWLTQLPYMHVIPLHAVQGTLLLLRLSSPRQLSSSSRRRSAPPRRCGNSSGRRSRRRLRMRAPMLAAQRKSCMKRQPPMGRPRRYSRTPPRRSASARQLLMWCARGSVHRSCYCRLTQAGLASNDNAIWQGVHSGVTCERRRRRALQWSGRMRRCLAS